MPEQNATKLTDLKCGQPRPEHAPFFERYLERQDLPAVRTDVRAGKPDQTMKYPSDGDEW